MQQDLLLGSKKEHFHIVNNKITEFSENMIKYLMKYRYIGPFKICFPGCEKITEILEEAFLLFGTTKITSIDLSCMKGLKKIGDYAFQVFGANVQNFEYINLSCPQLRIIGEGAFRDVGLYSKYVKLIFNCPNLEIINRRAFENVAYCPNEEIQQRIINYQWAAQQVVQQVDDIDQQPDNQQLENNQQQYNNIVLDLSNCPKLHTIESNAFSNYSNEVYSLQAEIKLPPNIKHIKEQAFKYAFNGCKQVFIDLSNKLQLQYIDQCCFHHLPYINIVIKNCPELIYIKQQFTQYTTNITFDIDTNTCPKLKELFGYDFVQYKYYKHLNKDQLFLEHQSKYLTDLSSFTTRTKLRYLVQQLKEQQIIQQYQSLDIKYKHQQILLELDNLQSTSNELQKDIDLREQIIKEQHEQYMFLKKQVELFNQQYSKEDDQ